MPVDETRPTAMRRKNVPGCSFGVSLGANGLDSQSMDNFCQGHILGCVIFPVVIDGARGALAALSSSFAGLSRSARPPGIPTMQIPHLRFSFLTKSA